ncbi:uncharacterized protein LOC107226094 [Neodiprion lecontei]|uniref:Uncharacterized protein LOC107226094 n=1 Tax=Neodiprion lecontei TaxID=441921 RepID=A0A6J0C5R2_NEOLC|nr:uncharacterized protein LOC107226094 [Neodiprion lecontei]
MRLRIVTLIALCLIAACNCADEDYEYDDEAAAAPVAPVTPAPARNAGRLALLTRGRGPTGRKPAPTTTTTAKPVEEPVEEEGNPEDYEAENQEAEEEVQTTTTEAPKKVRGGVRPFRSNEDLLAALKRRRAQVVNTNSIRDSPATDSAEPTTQRPKSISSNNSRSRGGQAADSASKSNRGRFGATRATAKPVQEEVEEETQQEEVEVKPKPFRRG